MPEITYLTDPQIPLRIEYSRPVMERIRGLAVDGLMALPRIGMGVGGLLLGVREDGIVRLIDSIEIQCSHASGPSFLLTNEEKDRARELIAGAGVPGVIGWYCSKTRGAITLGETDIAFYRELFPNREQIALVLRPSTVEPTRAVFFFRNENGEVVKGLECEVEEWRPEPAVSDGESETGLAVPEVEEPVAESISFPGEPVEVSEPEPPPPVATPAMPIRPLADPDPFAFTGKPRRQSKRMLWIGIGALLVTLAAAGWFTQNFWIPRPPLNLTSTESGGSLVIRWNPDAFRGIDHASLFINEDGKLQSLPLDRFQLNQGILHYVHGANSQRVSAKLAAGENSSIAVWLAPVPAPPAPNGATGATGSP